MSQSKKPTRRSPSTTAWYGAEAQKNWAERAGKAKAVVQNVFIGSTIAWFAWKDALDSHAWAGWFRNFWDKFHGALVAITLGGAVVLTVYSLFVYIYRYRALLKGGK